MATIKGTTERILDIRTSLLVIRGNQLITKDEKIDLMGKQVTDALNIATNEVTQRGICDDRLFKERRKNKVLKWLPWGTLLVGYAVGTQLAK